MWNVGFIGLSVLLMAIWIGIPHRDLDLKHTIIPMVKMYSGNNYADTDNDSSILNGTVILITGATSGIGLSLTKLMISLGASVIALGRSETKLNKLKRDYPNIQTVQADLSSLRSVSDAANEIREKFGYINIIVNNAGMHAGVLEQVHLTAAEMQSKTEGLDEVFVVNYLSHFLLTEKLASVMRPNSNNVPPRIVQITSTYHLGVDGSTLLPTNIPSLGINAPAASIPGNWRGWKLFRGQQSYAASKLAQIYHSRVLKAHHPVLANVTIRNVCPFWVATEITRVSPIFTSFLTYVAFPVDGWGISSALHAMFGGYDDSEDYIVNVNGDPSVYLPSFIMTSPLLRDIAIMNLATLALFAQKFVAKSQPQQSSPESYNMTIARELYDWSYNTIKPYL